MEDTYCDQEQAVITAVCSGNWERQVQAHAERCDSCSEAVRVSRLLKSLDVSSKPQLAPAGFVWWQARLYELQTGQKLLSRYFAVIRAATLLALTIGIVGLIGWRWSEVSESVNGIVNPSGPLSSSTLDMSLSSVVYLSVALLCLNIVLTIRDARNRKRE